MLATCISDLHLGQSFGLGALKDFLADQRKRVRPDMLILAGDILELAWMSWPQLQAQKLAMDALDELRAFATGIEVSYLPGNHDRYDQIPKDEINPIHVIAPPVIPGAVATPLLSLDGVVYTHGDGYDASTHVWDALLRLPVKAFSPWLYLKLYASPFETKTAGKEQEYSDYVFWIQGRATRDAIKHGTDLVFGHTHWPCILDLGGRVIGNSGDWQGNNSYIEAKDGKLSLRFWR